MSVVINGKKFPIATTTKINLKFSNLTSLPESIGNLKNLTILVLLYNKLVTIPESIGNLTNLTYLDLGNNRLVSLPDSIGKLDKLEFFNISNNPFTDDQELQYQSDDNVLKILKSRLSARGSIILNNFIGPDISPDYEALYHIPMSQEFVKQTQYKPLPLDNDDLRILLNEGVQKPHIVYACPVGHLHSAGECGVPTEISRCGFDGCKLFVGGLHHMLVPGSYIVYHDGYKYAKLWYGYFPVQSYRIYKRLVNQANTARRKMNPPEPDIILKPQTREEIDQERLIIARPLKDDDEILDMYLNGNVMCNICGDDIKLGEDDLYILPNCGHLLHRDDVEGYREGNLNNIYEYEDGGEDIADAEMAKRTCPVAGCGRRFAFGKSNRKTSRRKSKRKAYKRKSRRKSKTPKRKSRRKSKTPKRKSRRKSRRKAKTPKRNSRRKAKTPKRKSRRNSRRNSRRKSKTPKRKSRRKSKKAIK